MLKKGALVVTTDQAELRNEQFQREVGLARVKVTGADRQPIERPVDQRMQRKNMMGLEQSVKAETEGLQRRPPVDWESLRLDLVAEEWQIAIE